MPHLTRLFSRSKQNAGFHSTGIFVCILGALLALSFQTQPVKRTNLVEVDIRLVPKFPHKQAERELRAHGADILESSEYFNRISCRIDTKLLDSLRRKPWVVAIQVRPTPVPQNDDSGSSIGVNLVQGPPWGLPNAYNLTGTGVRVGIFDGGHPGTPVTAGVVNVPIHPDLGGRWIPEETGVPTNDFHATHVAGTNLGDGSQSASQGGTPLQWHGMAPAAWAHTWWFGFPETKMLDSVMGNAPSGKPIDLSSNSWAYTYSSVFANCPNLCPNNTSGTYMMQCGDADKLVWDKKLSIFVAAGNYQSCPSHFFSVTPLSTAKNVIAVGAVTKTDAMTGFSSWGPTLDGRLKPDVVAVGQSVKSTGTSANNYATLSGTSMACPAVSGLGALLIERYRQVTSNNNLDPALLKAVLLNSATDLGNGGPDFKFGYGKVDAVRSLGPIDNGTYAIDTIGHTGVKTYPLSFPATSNCVKVMLVWSDREYSGLGCNNPTLINNLDLELVDPNGNVYLPLTLDPTPGNENNPAFGLVNHRDTVEQVVVSHVTGGSWTARVIGSNVPLNPQEFAITWDTNAACPCVQPPADLVDWWPFDRPITAGFTADTAGQVANDGSVSGAAYSQGVVDRALCFNGVNDFVSVPTENEVNSLGNCHVDVPDEFTIDAWVKTTDATGVTPILDKRTNPSSPRGYQLFLYNGRLGFQMGNGVGGSTCGVNGACENYVSSGPNLANGSWHQIAVTVKRFCQRTGSVFEGYLYVDGVQVLNFVPRSGSISNNAPLLIGKAQPAFGSRHFSGCIDEVEFFKRALTPAEISSIYSAGSLGKCK